MNKLLQLASFALIFGSVFATKQPCCFSKVFNGKLSISTAMVTNGSSDPTFTENQFILDFDVIKNMTRVTGTMYQQSSSTRTTTHYVVIADYNNQTQYSLGNVSGVPFCQKEATDPRGLQDACVPSTLKWKSNYTLGAGPEAVLFDTWEGIGADGFQYSIQTAVEGCVPLMSTKFGMLDDGTRVMEFVQYADAEVDRYSMPDPFKLPDIC